MKAAQPEGGQAGAAAPVAAKPPAAPRRPPVAKAAEIDYEKIANIVNSIVDNKLTVFMRTNGIDTQNLKTQDPADIILGDGTLLMGGIDVAAIDTPMHSDYFAELAFMEESVTVMVHETDDQNAENPVMIGNNGIFKVFHRGIPTLAKRKFVDGLIVKSTRVSTPEVLNAVGERTNIIKQHSAHKYSFTMIQDRNPRGVEWLTRRMAEVI